MDTTAGAILLLVVVTGLVWLVSTLVRAPEHLHRRPIRTVRQLGPQMVGRGAAVAPLEDGIRTVRSVGAPPAAAMRSHSALVRRGRCGLCARTREECASLGRGPVRTCARRGCYALTCNTCLRELGGRCVECGGALA